MATTTAQYSIMPKRLRPRRGVSHGQEDPEIDNSNSNNNKNNNNNNNNNLGSCSVAAPIIKEQTIQTSDLEVRRRRRHHRHRHRHRHHRTNRDPNMERDHPEAEVETEAEDFVHVGRPMPARYHENDSAFSESSPHVAASISASASVSVSHADVTDMTEASSITTATRPLAETPTTATIDTDTLPSSTTKMQQLPSLNTHTTTTVPNAPATNSKALVLNPPLSPNGGSRKPPLSPSSPITPPAPPRFSMPLPPGMVNLGNTCYMNASVHMLMSLPHFVADLCAHEAALRRALQLSEQDKQPHKQHKQDKQDKQSNQLQTESQEQPTPPSHSTQLTSHHKHRRRTRRHRSESHDASLPDDATASSSASELSSSSSRCTRSSVSSRSSQSSSRSSRRRRRRGGFSTNLLDQRNDQGTRDTAPSPTASQSSQEETKPTLQEQSKSSQEETKTLEKVPPTPSPVLLRSLADLAVKLGKLPPQHSSAPPPLLTPASSASQSVPSTSTSSSSRPAKKRSSVNPFPVKSSMDKVAPHFRGFHQQDAHEFVSSLIDHLHEEITKCRDHKKVGESKSKVPPALEQQEKPEQDAEEEKAGEGDVQPSASEEQQEDSRKSLKTIITPVVEEPSSGQDEEESDANQAVINDQCDKEHGVAEKTSERTRYSNVPRKKGEMDTVEAIRAAASDGSALVYSVTRDSEQEDEQNVSLKDQDKKLQDVTTMVLPQHFSTEVSHGSRRTVVHDDVDEVVLHSFGTSSGSVGGPCGVFSVIYDYMDCVSVGVRGGEQSAPAVEVVDGQFHIQQGAGDDNFSIEASAGGGSTCASSNGDKKSGQQLNIKNNRIMDWARNSIGSKRDVGVEVVVASEDEDEGGDESALREELSDGDADTGRKTALSTGYVRVSSRRRAWGGTLSKQERLTEGGFRSSRRNRSRRRNRRRNANGSLESPSPSFVDDADDTTSTTEVDGITATTSEDDSSSSGDCCPADSSGSTCAINDNCQSNSEQSDGGKKEQLFGPNHHSRRKNEPKVEMPLPSPPPPPPLPTDHFCMEVKVKLVCTSPSCSYTRTRREMYRHISIDVGPTTGSNVGGGIVNKVGSSSKKAAAAVGSSSGKDSQDQASNGSTSPPKRHRWSVEDGIRAFFAPKVLELTCEKCETCKTATQYIEIVTLPRALLVHLKRFVVHISTSSSNGVHVSVKKDSSRVGHKERIDLSHYCSSTEEGGMLLVGDDHDSDDPADLSEGDGAGGEAKEKKQNSDDTEQDKTRGFVFPIGCANYRLRSVVHHIGGSASSGHYIADALVSSSPAPRRRSLAASALSEVPAAAALDAEAPELQGGVEAKDVTNEGPEVAPSWLRFNDEIVSAISRKEVMGKDSQGSAYMIMYELDCPGGMEVEADVVSAYNKKHGGMWHLPKWMVKRLRRMHLTRR